MIYVKHKSTMRASIEKKFPGAAVVDVTSKGPEPYVRLSPFYPVGGVPVPFTQGVTAQSVEGVWQGLKVFETADVDVTKFDNDTMKRLKRTVRRFGKCLGHRKGVHGTELLGYIEARKQIYLPMYNWMLENKAGDILDKLREISAKQDLVLLDYEINGNVDDGKRPLSHAYLVKYFLERA